MTAGEPSLVAVAANITLILLLLGMGLAFFRLLRGPDAADRIVALDLISILVVAFLAVYAVFTDEATFINVAIAYALVAFLGTIALARYRLNSCRTPPADAPELDGKGCAVIFPEAADSKRDHPPDVKQYDQTDVKQYDQTDGRRDDRAGERRNDGADDKRDDRSDARRNDEAEGKREIRPDGNREIEADGAGDGERAEPADGPLAGNRTDWTDAHRKDPAPPERTSS